MKKILILAGVVLLFWSCAAQSITQAPSGQASSNTPSIAQKPAGPGPVEQKFKGKTRTEVFEAIKSVLAERAYTIKTADFKSGLITAVGQTETGDESLASKLTILVFTDAKGIPNVQIEYAKAGETEEAGKQAAQGLMAALQPILK